MQMIEHNCGTYITVHKYRLNQQGKFDFCTHSIKGEIHDYFIITMQLLYCFKIHKGMMMLHFDCKHTDKYDNK